MRVLFSFVVFCSLLAVSCQEEQKVELCENEELLHSLLPSAKNLYLDSIYDELKVSTSVENISQIVSNELAIENSNFPSMLSFLLIDADGTKFPSHFVNFRPPGSYVFNHQRILINEKNHLTLNGKKLMTDSLTIALKENLLSEPETWFNVYFNWDKNANSALITQTLNSCFKVLSEIREINSQKKFGEPFCDLDSNQILHFGPNRYCLTFEKHKTPSLIFEDSIIELDSDIFN